MFYINSDGDIWIEMMLDRNRTSHMYYETTELNIVEKIKERYIKELNMLKNALGIEKTYY